MKSRQIIELRAESEFEEQTLLSEFPEVVWLKLGEFDTRFFVPISKENDKKIKRLSEHFRKEN